MTGFLKRAWIRNAGVPQGQPARGRISCPCGQAPESDYSPTNGDVTCACGSVYTWDGWIKPSLIESAAQAVEEFGEDELERAGAYRVYQDPLDLLNHLDEVGVRVLT